MKKKLLMAALLGSACLAVAGCGQKEAETEKVTEAAAQTEAETAEETEAETETETAAQTETETAQETEAATEAETETERRGGGRPAAANRNRVRRGNGGADRGIF